MDVGTFETGAVDRGVDDAPRGVGMHSTSMSATSNPGADGGLGALWRRYLLSGDEDAMDEVVSRTRRRLLAAARRIGDPADAEDAVQSAYLSLLRRGDAVASVPVYPWLLTAAVRLAYRRKAQKQRKKRCRRFHCHPSRHDRH